MDSSTTSRHPVWRWLRLPAPTGNASLLLTIAIVNSLALSSVGALINPYLRDLGMSAAFVGAYFSLLAMVQGISSFVGGFAADRYGRRRVWITGKMLQLSGYLLLATGLRGGWLLVAAVLVGASQIAIGAAQALQADASQSGWRATYFAVIMTVNSLASAVAPLAGGLLADRYGPRWAFLAIVPVLLLVARMISGLAEKPPAGVAAAAGAAGAAGATASARPARTAGGAGGLAAAAQVLPKALAKARGLLRAVVRIVSEGPYPRTGALILAHHLVNGTMNGIWNITLPLLLRDRFGVGYAGIGGLSTAMALGSALMMITGARLADQHGRRRVILASQFATTLLAVAIPFLGTVSQYYVMLFLIGLVSNAANGAFAATQMECVGERDRATFGGALAGIANTGFALGSLAAGVAYGFGQLVPVFAALVLVVISTIMLAVFLEETGARAAGRAPQAQAAPAK